MPSFAPGLSPIRYVLLRLRRMADAEERRAKHAAYMRDWAAANREKVRAACRAWYARNAEARRQAAQRYRETDPEKVRESQRQAYARDPAKARAKSRRWRQANPEKALAQAYAWKAANPEKVLANACALKHKRRAQMSTGALTAGDIRTLRETADGLCAYCLKPCKRLTLEHCIPLARGGTHAADNIVFACGSCNSRKGTRTPLEFLCGLPQLGAFA